MKTLMALFQKVKSWIIGSLSRRAEAILAQIPEYEIEAETGQPEAKWEAPQGRLKGDGKEEEAVTEATLQHYTRRLAEAQEEVRALTALVDGCRLQILKKQTSEWEKFLEKEGLTVNKPPF